MKGFIRKIIFGLNSITALCLILAYISPYVNPISFWPISFLGLAAPYLILFQLLFLLVWLLLKDKYILLPIVVLLLGFQTIPRFIQIFPKKIQTTEKGFKVMSFNVRLFDLYMWTKEKEMRSNIFKFLKEEDPDVLCIQEFYHSDGTKYEFNTIDSLVNILEAKNYHVYYTQTQREFNHWGIITFSKYPIVNKGLVPFDEVSDNVCIYTDIVKGKDTLRLYNAHLASLRLERRDYKTVKKEQEEEFSPDFKEGKRMHSKIRNGFKVRALQADSIHQSIKDCSYPIIFCGDFNDTPSSYAYQKVKGNLVDAFQKSGKGMGRTYIGKLPSFRIDYILHDKRFASSGFITHDIELSDHRPISTYLSLE